jgi:hypothetical protein
MKVLALIAALSFCGVVSADNTKPATPADPHAAAAVENTDAHATAEHATAEHGTKEGDKKPHHVKKAKK